MVQCIDSAPCFFLQRITATVNNREQKRMLMDLDVSMRSRSCNYTVQFYGAMFREGDVWICMEVMDCSLYQLYRRVFCAGQTIPEECLAHISLSVSLPYQLPSVTVCSG